MNDKTQLINEQIKTKQYKGPIILYKYRPFDAYTFDMFENNYLFLYPPIYLDDPTECMTTIDIKKFIDLEDNNLKREFTIHIIQMLKPYTSQENYDQICNLLRLIMKPDGAIAPNLLLEYSEEIKKYLPNDYDLVPFINYVVGIPEMIDSWDTKNKIEEMINLMFNAREDMGICSLSENFDDEYMWQNYAKNHEGYCVEYDLTEYEYSNQIYPVVYVKKEELETDLIESIVLTAINDLILSLSDGKILGDRSQCMKLFLTKHEEWAYQNEWRLIGNAKEKFVAPKIKAVYVGKNSSKENVEKLIMYSREMNFNIKRVK